MIIKPSIAENTVVSFRLVTGETLIAKFVKRTETALHVTRPVVANATQSEQGFGVFFSPFCVTVDEDNEFKIPVSAILFDPIQPRDELKANYIKITTGLDIPTA